MNDLDIRKDADGWKSLAAKTDPAGDHWLPLWLHSTDVCGIAERLYREWLPIKTRQAMIGQSDPEEFVRAVRAAAVLHDIGKATVLFQARIAADRPPVRERVESTGLSLPGQEEVKRLQAHAFPHAAAGEAILLILECPMTFAEVIGAHHGVPWQEGRELRAELEGEWGWRDPRANSLWGDRQQRAGWQNIQREAVKDMLSIAGLASVEELPELSQPAAVLLTGLVIMADWIASNELYFPLLPTDRQEIPVLPERLEQGWRAVNLPPAWQAGEMEAPDRLMRDQFGFDANPVQRMVMDAILHSENPGLMILEAPMGVGKTEAALTGASLLSARGVGGIFFGLPTQATANAIFDRVAEWGRKQPEGNQISIRLAHGMADMNETYRSLMQGNQESAVEEDGNQKDRLLVHEWFRGRKQALLSDFVTGTVDQVLMSALRQKHVMLLHLGLSGKAVIIDECHAYDAFMNQYLEEALRWLGAYGTPVLMLSATLPAERRAAFLAAYLNKSERAGRRLKTEAWYGNRGYPALTWTDGAQICQKVLSQEGPGKEIAVLRVPPAEEPEREAEEIADLLKENLSDGGCAAVVVNTVKRAQTFAEILQQAMPDMTVLLLHARFVMADRLRLEEELLRRMGKHSTASERDRVIVVGTQVIEQSLDFDADVMVTDLCPIDLLLQRVGRLHRHAAHDSGRPARLREPQCHVLGTGETPERGAERIYGAYLLARTRALLPDRIRVPEDISTLVNDVYDEQAAALPETAAYVRAREKHREREDDLKRGAQAFRIHHPERPYNELLSGRIPSDEEHERAQVRAGELTMDIVLLCRLSSDTLAPMPWLRKNEAWRTDECPSPEEARTILAQKVNLGAGITRALEGGMTWDEINASLAVPPAWEQSAWLKNIHMLVLGEDLKTSWGGYVWEYHPKWGLRWRKE